MNNLLWSMAENFVMMDRISRKNDYGGTDKVWIEGAAFQAVVIKNNSPEVKLAEQQGVKEIFTIVVDKGTELEYHDVIRRVSDGDVFRITSITKDSEAPMASTVPITKVTAERWELTGE